MVKILNPYFKLLRISDWRGYILMSLFGFILAKGFLFPVKEIIVFWGIVVSFLGFGFSINDCFDTKEDVYDKTKENPLITDKASFKKSLFFSFLLGLLGLGLSAFFGLKIFLFCLVGLLIGFFYSAPPIRFKSRPFLDLISHGFFAGIFLFILSFLIFKTEITRVYWVIASYVFYFSVTLEMRNHLEDYESDKAAGINTSVVSWGHGVSKKILDYLIGFYPLILFPVFLIVPYKILLLFLFFSFVFVVIFLFKKNLKIVENYKIADIYTIICFSLLSLAMIL
ncbi:MAG: UbiA prenyltransferase family protein [Patescibacteria group bacterium]|nr:UbiA prenyltransferase family protein [Patescibacteria group bacterium]